MGQADEKKDLPSPQAVLMRMAYGYREAKALQVVAELGIANLVAQGSKTAEELSKVLGVDSDALYRLLRALASEGIFKEGSDSRFENTPLSEAIRNDVPGSVRDYVINAPDDGRWLAWSKFMDVVKTGKASFEDVNGCDKYEYFRRHPDIGERCAIVRPYPFDVNPLEVSFPARLVPRRPYASQEDFLRHFYKAERITISYSLHATCT